MCHDITFPPGAQKQEKQEEEVEIAAMKPSDCLISISLLPWVRLPVALGLFPH